MKHFWSFLYVTSVLLCLNNPAQARPVRFWCDYAPSVIPSVGATIGSWPYYTQCGCSGTTSCYNVGPSSRQYCFGGTSFQYSGVNCSSPGIGMCSTAGSTPTCYIQSPTIQTATCPSQAVINSKGAEDFSQCALDANGNGTGPCTTSYGVTYLPDPANPGANFGGPNPVIIQGKCRRFTNL